MLYTFYHMRVCVCVCVCVYYIRNPQKSAVNSKFFGLLVM